MKRFFVGFLLVVSFCGLIACAEYEEDENYESIQEQCKKDPSLPICDEPIDDIEDNNDGNMNIDNE